MSAEWEPLAEELIILFRESLIELCRISGTGFWHFQISGSNPHHQQFYHFNFNLS